MENAIEINSLRKVFKENTAIEDVSFNVKQGEIFGLLGPSGSGKTTMIKILTGQLNSTSGHIEVLGMESNLFKTAKFKEQIGILSDNSALYERLTVYDNLKLFCKLYNAPLKAIDEILAVVNLYEEKTKVVSKLSKGMKQRILLAKALLHKPKLVFLDEPTSALDPGNIVHIHNGLRALNKAGTTIFLTTHNMEEATLLCDRVAFLHNGEISELDNPDYLRHRYSTGVFHIETIDGRKLTINNDPENAVKIKELVASDSIKRMYTDYPTLGQVFLKLTGKELI